MSLAGAIRPSWQIMGMAFANLLKRLLKLQM